MEFNEIIKNMNMKQKICEYLLLHKKEAHINDLFFDLNEYTSHDIEYTLRQLNDEGILRYSNSFVWYLIHDYEI